MFNLKMGMTKQEVEAVTGELTKVGTIYNPSYSYSSLGTGNVSKLEHGFLVTSVNIHPIHGLYYMEASKKVRTDGFGTELKILYNEVQQFLDGKYGDNGGRDVKRVVQDFLSEEGYWYRTSYCFDDEDSKYRAEKLIHMIVLDGYASSYRPATEGWIKVKYFGLAFIQIHGIKKSQADQF